MNLYDQAKADVNQITGNGFEWGEPITLIAPNAQQAIVNGIHAKHHTEFNEDGFPVNGKIANIAISEDNVLAINASYPLRTNGEIHLQGHLVTVKDSTGIDQEYVIQQWFPDETIGLIVCILSDYE